MAGADSMNDNVDQQEEWLYGTSDLVIRDPRQNAVDQPLEMGAEVDFNQNENKSAEENDTNDKLGMIFDDSKNNNDILDKNSSNNNKNNVDDEEDTEESDIEIVIGEMNSNDLSSSKQKNVIRGDAIKVDTFDVTSSNVKSKPSAQQQIEYTPANLPALDAEFYGNYEGKTMAELDLDAFTDKPWNQPGSDITDYFNYGFNETSWRAYCQKQQIFKQMFATTITQINQQPHQLQIQMPEPIQNQSTNFNNQNIASTQNQNVFKTPSNNPGIVNFAFPFQHSQQLYSNFPLSRSRIGYTSIGAFITDHEIDQSLSVFALQVNSSCWDSEEQLKSCRDDGLIKPNIVSYLAFIHDVSAPPPTTESAAQQFDTSIVQNNINFDNNNDDDWGSSTPESKRAKPSPPNEPQPTELEW